jgi:hypothetical protein
LLEKGGNCQANIRKAMPRNMGKTIIPITLAASRQKVQFFGTQRERRTIYRLSVEPEGF